MQALRLVGDFSDVQDFAGRVAQVELVNGPFGAWDDAVNQFSSAAGRGLGVGFLGWFGRDCGGGLVLGGAGFAGRFHDAYDVSNMVSQ